MRVAPGRRPSGCAAVVAVALVGALLAGCTAGTGPSPDAGPGAPTTGPTPSPHRAPTPGPVTPTADAVGSPRGTAWKDWRPATPPVLAPISDEEADRRIHNYLESVAEGFNVSVASLPPRVRIVRLSEIADVLAQCSTDAGFPATVSSDGRARSDLPADRARALAELACAAQYPPDPRFLGDGPQPAVLGVVWEYLDTFLVPCLRAHGQEPSVQLPPREQFVRDPTWDGYPWSLPPLKQNLLEVQCPQSPPYEAVEE